MGTRRDGRQQRQAHPAEAQHHYEVTPADLPLACPMPSMQLWNSHPRVYLPVEQTGWAKCPYCSAEFVLSDRKGGNDQGVGGSA